MAKKKSVVIAFRAQDHGNSESCSTRSLRTGLQRCWPVQIVVGCILKSSLAAYSNRRWLHTQIVVGCLLKSSLAAYSHHHWLLTHVIVVCLLKSSLAYSNRRWLHTQIMVYRRKSDCLAHSTRTPCGWHVYTLKTKSFRRLRLTGFLSKWSFC